MENKNPNDLHSQIKNQQTPNCGWAKGF